jgi:hypothetical protein
MTQTVAPIAKLDSEGISSMSVSLWQITWRRLFRRKSALVGMGILGVLIARHPASTFLAARRIRSST